MDGGLISRIKMEPLKTIVEAWRMFDLKKAAGQGRAVRFGNHRYEIVGAFLTVPEKTPSHEQGFLQVAFKDDTQNFRPAEEKLQDESLGFHLKGLIQRQARQIHGIGHHDGCGFISFE